MPGPLDGIRVLDFTERVQGPYATQLLGDLGAEIIKVERRQALTPDGRPDDRYPEGERTLYTAAFLAVNRNKKSVGIDLKTAGGRAIIHRLVSSVDVVYENFRPGVMDRLGLGYEACRELNPSIVYASASGYGSSGPYAERPGQDVLVQALSGLGTLNAAADGRPQPIALSMTDVMGGMNGAVAVLAALFHRARTGEGQKVETSLLASALAAQSEQAVLYLNSDVGEPMRASVMHAHPYIPPPYGFYATADGYIALSSGRQLSELSELIGVPDLARDPRFDTFEKRLARKAELDQIIEDGTRVRTTSEWLSIMVPRDFFVAPVASYAEAFEDPQVVHSGLIATVDSPIGPIRLVAPPFQLSETPASVRLRPPQHSEHTDEILTEFGFGPDEIDHFRDGEVI